MSIQQSDSSLNKLYRYLPLHGNLVNVQNRQHNRAQHLQHGILLWIFSWLRRLVRQDIVETFLLTELLVESMIGLLHR